MGRRLNSRLMKRKQTKCCASSSSSGSSRISFADLVKWVEEQDVVSKETGHVKDKKKLKDIEVFVAEKNYNGDIVYQPLQAGGMFKNVYIRENPKTKGEKQLFIGYSKTLQSAYERE